MLKQFLYVLVISTVFTAEVDAMYAVVKRLQTPSHRTFRRAIITSPLLAEIEAVGLTHCMKAYRDEMCKNRLCCRDLFNKTTHVKFQQTCKANKAFILKTIDQTEGRLAFVQRLQYFYNELTRIASCSIGDVDEDEIRYFIAHQQSCLRNQLRLIQENQEDDREVAFINDTNEFMIDNEYLRSEQCRSAYERKKCHSSICCKDIFKIHSLGEIMGWRDPDVGDPTLYQIIHLSYSRRRKNILKEVDTLGPLNFLLNIQKDYNALCATQKTALEDVKKDKTLEALLKRVFYKKICLQKQIFVLNTERPNIHTWEDGIDEKGRVSLFGYYPFEETRFNTDEDVEMSIALLLKKIQNNGAVKE